MTSRDGKLRAEGMRGVVEVQAKAGGAPRRLRGHRGEVILLAFSADGARLATASDDGTVIVWRVGR